jgi:hypothetical protein
MTDLLGSTLAAASDQDPQDVGTAGPLGLALIVVLLIAIGLLGRSMGKHLKKVPRSFDGIGQPAVLVPDDAAELFEPRPGEALLEQLRRAPLAIEAPRDQRPGGGLGRSDRVPGDRPADPPQD